MNILVVPASKSDLTKQKYERQKNLVNLIAWFREELKQNIVALRAFGHHDDSVLEDRSLLLLELTKSLYNQRMSDRGQISLAAVA